MAKENRVDPYPTHPFKLQIDDFVLGHFKECSGLNERIDIIQYREGGTAGRVGKFPGAVEYGDVTLKYGVTSSGELWSWMLEIAQGKLSRKNVDVIMIDNDHSSTFQWKLVNACPTTWDGPSFRTDQQETAIESVSLSFESFIRK